ncbi:MAG: hypothetical protein KGO50_09145 [Myxococcales bacterium]|nr:hypothetical protein [Myxococcales bacterium]
MSADRTVASLLLGLLCACSNVDTQGSPAETSSSDTGVTDGENHADSGDEGSVPPIDPFAAEPPEHPFLADSVWAASHRTPYAQGSSPLPGPVIAGSSRHLSVPGIPITLTFSAPYPDGRRTIWASLLGTSGAIIKLDHASFTPIDIYIPGERETDAPVYELGISGAYNLLDIDQHLIVTRGRFLEVFGDETPSSADSPITLLKRFALPDSFFCGQQDTIVGITMLWTGELAIATAHGVVGVLPREPEAMQNERLLRYAVNGAACEQATVDSTADGFHIVSNSIAADETGGIYVVSSQAMMRFQYDGTAISLAWEAAYNVGETGSGIRLGAGSGSTPSLMGLPQDDDRFVVITDAQDIMHLVLFWRDDIPADWQPLSPNHDRRIACEVPVTFGNPDATVTVSEQSVLVREYASVVVNNQLADESVLAGFSGPIRNILSALESGRASQAPFGVERIDWNPQTRSCATVWVNPDISVPNTIPAMSADSRLFYGVGLQDGLWGLHALDFDTGESRFFTPAPTDSCDQAFLDSLGDTFSALLTSWIEELPQLCENTTFAATQVGPDGTAYTGTFFGVTRYQ